jgi:hypothetical protein
MKLFLTLSVSFFVYGVAFAASQCQPVSANVVGYGAASDTLQDKAMYRALRQASGSALGFCRATLKEECSSQSGIDFKCRLSGEVNELTSISENSCSNDAGQWYCMVDVLAECDSDCVNN